MGETEVSDDVASDLLTNNCITSLDNVFEKLIELEHIGIDKEDIFFAWLGKYDEHNTKMTICTLSYPSYHFLHQALPGGKVEVDELVKEQAEAIFFGRLTKEEALKALKHYIENMIYRLYLISSIKRNEFSQHMNSNDIIVSNWEFVQENGDWKIDDIAMRKLKECIMKPFYIRWQFRIKFAIATNADFTRRVLRYDYGTDYLFMLVLLNFAILSSVMIPN